MTAQSYAVKATVSFIPDSDFTCKQANALSELLGRALATTASAFCVPNARQSLTQVATSKGTVARALLR